MIHMQTSVIGCCGLVGFSGMPTTLPSFKSQIMESISRYQGREGYKPSWIGGSHVMITTSEEQPNAEQYLKEIGFEPSETFLNTNSENLVTVWLMHTEMFNDLVDTWWKESEKIKAEKAKVEKAKAEKAKVSKPVPDPVSEASTYHTIEGFRYTTNYINLRKRYWKEQLYLTSDTTRTEICQSRLNFWSQ